jgi:general secretion pathway protein D
MLLLLSLMASVQAASNQVTLNLKNVEINALIESVSTITGKNFIVDPRVKAQVSVISSKPMNENEVYEVFLAVLTVHGFAAVPSGPVIKIVPAAGAKQDTIPTVDRPGRDPTDQVVTEVIQVQNVSAAQIVPILRPLIPPQGQLAAYAPTNVLIISDIAGNVERVADIIRRMDRASDEEVEIIPLQHASATEVVRTVTTLEQAKTQAAAGQGAQAGTPARLVADERTNSILLSGDKGSRLRLRALVMHLDTPIQREGNTQVIYLRYAKAKDLAQVLTGVSKKIAEEQQQVAPGQQPQAAAPGRGGGGAAGNLIDIQADEPTNSLVITGPLEAIRALRSVIAQLDTRRAQVLVEAAIAEISSDRSAQLGIQWISAAKNVGIIGFTNFTLGLKLSDAVQTALSIANLSKSTTTTTGTTGTTTGTTSTTTTTGTTTGTTGTTSTTGTIGTLPAGTLSGFQGLNVAGGNLNGSNPFAILLTALAADVDTNLLSTPNLVTLDNEEAEIFVGQNLGLQTGTYSTNSTTGLAGNPFNTFERKDIGLKLTVKPQINEGNAVRLEIEQSVEDIPNPTDQNPLYTKRKIKTKVLVEDGQILVLGGLIKDNLSESIQKVPLLGDIPLLGELFRYRTGDKTKSNLMIFLHPVILRNGLQGTLATNDKYTYIREEQEAARLQRGNSLLSDVKTPVLPSQEEVKQHNTMLDTAPPAKTAPPPQAAPPPPKPAPEPPTSSNHFNQ